MDLLYFMGSSFTLHKAGIRRIHVFAPDSSLRSKVKRVPAQ